MSKKVDEATMLRAVIHHMTLMLSDFGRHERGCCCDLKGSPHEEECKDCDCGLTAAIAFGVQQSGMPLEPPPMTHEEAQHFHLAGVAIVQDLLRRARGE